MIKDILSKVITPILFVIIGMIIGFFLNSRQEKNTADKTIIPSDVYIKDSLRIDSFMLEINKLDSINKFLKDSIKLNDSIVIIEKEEIKKLPLTEKVLFLKKKLEDYEKDY